MIEDFISFLKNFSIQEKKEKKKKKDEGKTFWQAERKDSMHGVIRFALTKEAIMWELKRAWASTYVRTYCDRNETWWVGENDSRVKFETNEEALEYRNKIIKQYGAR